LGCGLAEGIHLRFTIGGYNQIGWGPDREELTMTTDTWIDAVLYDMTRYVALNARHAEGISSDEMTGPETLTDPRIATSDQGQRTRDIAVTFSR
jgi:hypothetical protein